MPRTGRTRIRTEINRKGKKRYVSEYEYKFLFKKTWHNIIDEEGFEDRWFKKKKKAKKALGKYKNSFYETSNVEML